MSDEITVRVEDPKGDQTNYWNLRRDDYRGRKTVSRDRDYRPEQVKEVRDGISIDFNMNETRNLTERQREIILQTLIGNQEPYNIQNRDNSWYWPNTSIPLMALLAFFIAALILFILLVAASHPYYYF